MQHSRKVNEAIRATGFRPVEAKTVSVHSYFSLSRYSSIRCWWPCALVFDKSTSPRAGERRPTCFQSSLEPTAVVGGVACWVPQECPKPRYTITQQCCTCHLSGVRTNLRVSSAVRKKTRTSCPGRWKPPNDSDSARVSAGGSGWLYRSESATIADILSNRVRMQPKHVRLTLRCGGNLVVSRLLHRVSLITT